FGRKVIFDDLIEVLVVAPRHEDIIQALSFFINAEARLIAGVFVVRVVGKELMKDNPVRPGATNRKSVSYNCPLRLAIEAKDFTEIMKQPGKNKPAGMAVAADLFGSL